MLSVVEATARFLTSRNRAAVITRALSHWRFTNSDQLPEAFLVDIFPETVGRRVSISTDVRHHFELPYGERLVLASIVAALQPRTVFEFGTFTGSTTTLLADNASPDAVVHTLDLPSEELIGTGVADADVGARFTSDPRYGSRIVQHRANSRRFDTTPFERRVDLVYIDGSHQFDDVLHDSRLGLRMLAPGGVILWDDYQISALPVAAALDVFAKTAPGPLRRVFNTRLAVYRAAPEKP